MAGRGRPKTVLELSDDERAELERWSLLAQESPRLACRSRIVLACASGASNAEVSERLDVSVATVGKWRARFVAGRLEGLADRPRPGRPPVLDGERLNKIVVAAPGGAPQDGRPRWSTRQMAAAAGVSHSTVSRAWRGVGQEPHHDPGPPRPRVASPAHAEGDGKVHLLAALDTAGAKLLDSIEARPRGKRFLRKLGRGRN